MAGAGRAVRLVLAADDEGHDLVLRGTRRGRPPISAAACAAALVLFGELWLPLWDTINIATLGTLGPVIMAVPGGLSGGPQHHALGRDPRPIALFIIVASRSINSLIWALLLVAIIGPGLLAGLIVAIACGPSGSWASCSTRPSRKPTRPRSRRSGHRRQPRQVLNYGIVPQIMPAFWGITVFRWDINIRESTILGLVGAGGIGLKLQASLNTLAWSQVTVILLLILATVVLSEWVSARMRHAII
jgi:phosphonate transport system permease protein